MSMMKMKATTTRATAIRYLVVLLFLAAAASSASAAASSSSKEHQCHSGDKAALLAIKAALGNPYHFASWTADNPCCEWYDVECDAATGRVVGLAVFQDANLTGTIPDAVAGLVHLQSLRLHHLPGISGAIPPAIARLSSLSLLTISYTGVSGPVPAFLGKLTALNQLDLSFNALTGAVPAALAALLSSSIAQQTRFALCLAAAFSSPPANVNNSSSNAVLSPLSLHVALSLLAAGSGGATRDQLLAALAGAHGPGAADSLHALAEQVARVVMADGSEAGGPRIAFADAVFADASLNLKPAFQEVAVAKYMAHTHSVDFQNKAAEVAGQVNSWVEEVTTGTIKEILQPGSVDESTRLVLGNALYFKGAWANKFDASETRDGEFHLLNGTSVEAPFMSSRDDQYMASYGDFKVLRLPYAQGGDKRHFSMYILLPEAQDGLWSLAQRLTSEPEFLDRHIPTTKIPVGEIKVPKFKLSFGFEASQLLKGLGLHLPFSPEADLSEFVDSPAPLKLSVSAVLHKSFVEVNEEGTEAAAASVIVTRGTSFRIRHPDNFIADHPFLFLIREDTTGVVLSVGHVVNPLLA